MPNNGGTSAELLDLPSGGGSVSGSGSSFSVDLNTGTASVSFQLMIPAGPNGIKPALTLSYAASTGDGAFGLGWSIGLPTIVRKITPSAAPSDPTVTGFYSLTGVGDLVDMGQGRFRPVVDTTGQLIQFANGAWTITDRTDTSFTLGTSANAQFGSNPVAAWLIDRCTDSSGNAVVYTWLQDGTARYLGTISWGTYQIVFTYEPRPDLVINGLFGAPIQFAKRCNGIELHVTTEAQSLVRSWTFLYDDNGGRGRSLLTTIREQGHAADGTVLGAEDRSYGYIRPAAPKFAPVTGWTTALTDPDTDFVDLNGDGLPDLFQMGASPPLMHMNLGDGQFGYPQICTRAPGALRLSSQNCAFANMSGLGNVDLLVIGEPLAGYYPLSVPQGGTGPSQFGMPVVFEEAPPFMPGDPRVRLLDLNGDSITDMLVDTGGAWLIYLREGVSTWSTTPRLLAPDRTPDVDLTDNHVYVADMTGDGLFDIVRIEGGGVTFWPARADGGWGSPIAMRPSPEFTRDYDPSRMVVADIDGDGCADLVYVGPISVTVWWNVGAGQLSDPQVIAPTPPAQTSGWRLLDLLGAGTAGLLFQLPVPWAGTSRQAFLDLCGGVKPYLLNSFGNGPGQSTLFTYASSTQFALRDSAAGTPWQTYHPFPVLCIARTDQTDNATGVTASTVYSYHDARYDPVSHTFLGFGRVDSDQLGDATCPTLRTETTFHLGVDPADPTRPLSGDEALKLGALRRRVLQTVAYGLDGSLLQSNPYSITSHTYDALLVASGLNNGDQVAVPYATGTTEQRWERQSSVQSTRVIQYLAVNSEGDVTLQRTTAQRAGVATLDQDITTTVSFATGGVNLRQPARVTQTAAGGGVIAASVTYYDGDPFQGLPEGQATLGLVTRIEALAFTDAFVSEVFGAAPPDLTAYGYHRQAGDATGWWITRRAHQRTIGAGGSVLSTRGPLGATNTLQLDAVGQCIVAVTDEVGNTATAKTDPRVWQTASLTDINGQTTIDTFDALGRVTATIGPLDSAAAPLSTFAYTAAAASQIASTARLVHGQANTVTSFSWIGGGGQVLGKSAPGSVAGAWVVTGTTACNARGLATAAYLPYAVTGTGWQPPAANAPNITYSYDALGRIVQTTRPDGLTSTLRREGGTITVSETWPGGTASDVEQQVFDAAGQLISVSRNAGDHWVEQVYSYDAAGRLASVGLPGGISVLIACDLLGRRFVHQCSDTGRSIHLVDAGGNERVYSNAAGQRLTKTFDAANRVTAVTYDSEAAPRITYNYFDHGDPAPADGITVNRYGRPWLINDEIGTIVLQYDEAGNTISTVRTMAATSQVFTTLASFDALGRPSSLTLPATGGGGRVIDYGYGLDGQLATMSGVINTAAYDVYHRPTSIAYANGATSLIDYRPAGGGIARMRVTDASGKLLRDTTVTVADAFVETLTSATANDDSVSFAYDGLRRLTAANYSGAAIDAHAWTFDDTFALTKTTDCAALTYAPGTHRIASVGGQTVTFDAAGRMSQGRCGTMVFDAANHLASAVATNGTAVTHTYDCNGRRALSITGGVQSYASPLPSLEIRNGVVVCWITFGHQRIAADAGGQLLFLHANGLGNTDLITDGQGQYVCQVNLTPFGVTRAAAAPPAGAAATLVALLVGTDVTGLICQGQRWYDPQTGQFISPDPQVTGVYLIGAWNPYVYCLGNPIALCDPSGLSFMSVLGMIGIAIVAALLVVAAVYTGGLAVAPLLITSADGGYTLVGVAIGSFGGALAGEASAAKAGGSVLLGALLGAVIGGLGSLLGSAIVPISAATVSSGVPIYNYIISGAAQGFFSGMGTGLAVGFAGGKGSVGAEMIAMAEGAAWGATIGAILGLGVGSIVGNTGGPPNQFMNVVDLKGKFNDTSTWFTSVNSADNAANIVQQGQQFASPGGFTGFNVASSVLSDALSPSVTKAGLLSIPIDWLPSAVLQYGGFAAITNVSMAADQVGFSYASQINAIIGLAPLFADFIVDELEIIYPNTTDKVESSFNQAFGSAEG